ncbi:(2Fe-2S) ferredoxin domain-containing protein [Priestia abyssalis]|uniref:(2Fe-2S) ferredoxin domain-containing protein n=1 Tax=Priestia abyssalis TaxID=1221450 RepID=UPI000995672A|nr:(2Fe-2S) ferredoxin domain-containing protein [Priestia abyssalis]
MTTWNLTGTKHHVLICNGSSCMRKGGEEVTQAIRDEIKRLNLDDRIHTTRTRCNGRCKDACIVIAYPEGTWYKASTPEEGRRIISQHLAGGNTIEDAVIYEFGDEGMVAASREGFHEGISKLEKAGK